jgi:hypothetical protein
MSELERILRSALVPIEPPERLSDRLERGLSELTEAAADELAEWELSSMRDPRNWARPVAAVVVGTVAGGALVIVRARQQQRKRGGAHPLQAVERGLRGIADDLEKRLRR